jgi:hypothetical protein
LATAGNRYWASHTNKKSLAHWSFYSPWSGAWGRIWLSGCPTAHEKGFIFKNFF